MYDVQNTVQDVHALLYIGLKAWKVKGLLFGEFEGSAASFQVELIGVLRDDQVVVNFIHYLRPDSVHCAEFTHSHLFDYLIKLLLVSRLPEDYLCGKLDSPYALCNNCPITSLTDELLLINGHFCWDIEKVYG